VESTNPSKPDVFITGEMPNKQLKNRVTYDYRTPTQSTCRKEKLKVQRDDESTYK
jgi:hypothetical protein